VVVGVRDNEASQHTVDERLIDHCELPDLYYDERDNERADNAYENALYERGHGRTYLGSD